MSCDIQGEGKDVSDMIIGVNVFRAELNILSEHLQGNKFLHFPSENSALNNHAPASWALDRASESILNSYLDLGKGLKKHIMSEKLEPCLSFISNSLMQVDMKCISEKLAEAFNLNVG